MDLIVQAVCLVVIVLLAIWLHKVYPKKISIKTIALIAFFTVAKQVLTLLSLNIPLFGVPSLRIGISQLPLMIGGVLLGPFAAFFLGLVVDIVGLLVSPSEYPFLGFTLGTILCAVLPAIITNRFSQVKEPKKLLWALLVIVWLLNLLALFSAKEIKFSSEALLVLNFTNRLLLMLTVTLLLLIIVIVHKFVSNKIKSGSLAYELWFVAVVVVELIVNIILTPYWLQVMYGIPYFASLTIRIFKATVMLNVESALGYLVLLACLSLVNKNQAKGATEQKSE